MQEKIEVIQTGEPDQYIVENNFSDLGGAFFDRYVCFSGYFGNHGPHVFAAGPVLYEALEAIKHSIVQAQIPGNDWRRELKLIESTCNDALKLARGES